MRAPDWQSDDGLISLHNCDRMELLGSMDEGSVDIVVTSPPYNTLQGETKQYGFRANRKSGTDRYLAKVREIGYRDQIDEHEYQATLAIVVAHCIRVAQGPVWINHKKRRRDDEIVFPTYFLRFPVWCHVIWWRKGSMAQNCRTFKPTTEEIYGFGSRGYWEPDPECQGDVWPDVPEDMPNDVWGDIAPERGSEEHVCPWPLKIPLRLIKTTCPAGGTVLDPHMGRATAGMAVLRAGAGRKFIGADDDPRAFQAAVEFIQREYDRPAFAEQERAERTLFDAA